MSSSYDRLAAIRDYWMPRDEDARAEVRVTDLNEVLREIERLREEIEKTKARSREWSEIAEDRGDAVERLLKLLNDVRKWIRSDVGSGIFGPLDTRTALLARIDAEIGEDK